MTTAHLESKWYDNRVLLIILFFLLPPLGLYAMVKHKTAAWKKILYIIPAGFSTLFILLGIYLFQIRDNYKSGLDNYNKKDYIQAHNDFILVKPDDANYKDAISKITEIKPIVDSIHKATESTQNLNNKIESNNNNVAIEDDSQAKNEIKASQKTGFVSSKFSDFTFTSYLTLLIIIGCLLYSLVNNLTKRRKNNPYWTLIIGNISFMIFTSTVPDDFEIYTKILFFLSVICICWFAWIKMDENQENKDRGFIQSGKDSITNIVNSGKNNINKNINQTKDNIRNKAIESAGGGLLGDIAGSTVDVLTARVDTSINKASNKVDSKISSFFSFLGESGEYIDSNRSYINMLRFLLLASMLFLIFYI